jgi:hypothetical protein
MKRRDFIALVAASAGSTYAAMTALDLLARPTGATGKFQLSGESNRIRLQPADDEVPACWWN